MDLTVVSVVTTTRIRELTSRAPRDVSSSPELSLVNLTDPNLMNADLFLREPRSKSERKKKDASSLTSRRLTSRKFLRMRSTGTARPSRDTLTSTKKTDIKKVFENEEHRNSKTIKRHSYIYQEDKICTSQEPIIQCSHDSIPEEMRQKTVSYVCLPEGRVAKLYAERIERGESPQELKHQPVAFKAEMEQPLSCRNQ